MTAPTRTCFAIPMLLTALLLSSIFASAADERHHHVPHGLRFLAIGDWGGKEYWPYATFAQVRTAVGMAHIASSQSSSFVLALGDNFYSHGQSTPQRFRATYEHVYHQPSLQIPWYVCAGNHDHLGNVTAQLEHHDSDPRWNFPSLFYTVKKNFKVIDSDGTATTGTTRSGTGTERSKEKIMSVEFVIIDTVVLAGMHQLSDSSQLGYFDPLPGPRSPLEAQTYWEWIDRKLSQSTADYLFVAGHYPVYSACSHGNTDQLIEHLEPMLQKYDVTAYLSGHEHCAMHIDRGTMDYILTGTGDECCYEGSNIDGLPDDADLKYLLSDERNEHNAVGGFASFVSSPSGDRMTVVHHDHRGKELYSSELYPRSRMGRTSMFASPK